MHDSGKQMGKRQILMMIVGSVAVGDAEIFDDVPVLEGTAPPADWPVVREVVALVKELLSGYEYGASPEFDRSAQGKSPSVRAMLASMANDPDRQRKHQRRFEEALYKALDSDEAFQLAPVSKQDVLKRLIERMKTLSVPD